ncbi:MAG TPA: alginate export family protein [Candidatus Binatia bacterium]|nr:alginate export family protein [Candidatus Binatia bacterium]
MELPHMRISHKGVPVREVGRREGRPRWLSVTVVTALWLLRQSSFAQTLSPPEPPSYQLLRLDEDYRSLCNPDRRSDLWDPLKCIALNDTATWYLSLGGEARERYEYFHNPNWGQGPQDEDGYGLQRYMLHADLHLGEALRVFGQLKSGLENGRTGGGPRPTDEDKLDPHQAFLDVTLAATTSTTLVLRGGRQELLFGSQRLVSVREGPNVRQSFDGGRLILTSGATRVDVVLMVPVETNPGIFNDASDHARLFWGIYAVSPLALLPQGHMDLYYLGLDRKQARFDQRSGHELRHSIGTRLWGRPQPWDYNFEFVYQGGDFRRGAIQAWTAASDTGYTLPTVHFRPRLGLKANVASGDQNPRGHTLQTFNALFPKGAYFGEIALIGPANFFDLHPMLDIHLTKSVTLTTDWDFFWRQSTRDGIYGPAINLIRSGRMSRARYIGSQATVQAEWQVNRHTTLVGIYTHFFADAFLKETGPGRDVDYVTTWVTYRF